MAIPWPIAGAGLASCPSRVLDEPHQIRLRVLILVTAAYYGYTAYDLFSSRWVDPAAVQSGVEEKVKEGWTFVPCRRPGYREARKQRRPGRRVGHVVQELPRDGQTTLKEQPVVAR